jgi:outer membrane protein assembly factor BamA
MKAVRHHIAFCCFFLSLVNFCSAQIPTDSVNARIGTITLIGNKITKDRIIYRELTFKSGDSVDTTTMHQLFNRSEENLFNTSLFNSVDITYVIENDIVNIFIVVAERWYVFPLPIFEIQERNFNVWWQTKDWSRIVYGGLLNWNNFRGRNEQLSVTLRLGYTQRISFYYAIPYINKKQKGGLAFGFAYSRNHQSSVNTIDNQIIYYKSEEQFSKKEIGGSIAYTYRPSLYNTHVFEAGYRHASVMDSVVLLNNDYFTPGSEDISYSILRYFYKQDHRDIAFYPLKGYYFDFEIAKNGLPLFNDDIDLTVFAARLKKYWPLTKKFYFGSGLSAKYIAGDEVPYYLSRGLGYGKEFIRGYEYYVMDGQDYVLLKNTLKFELLPKKEIHAKFIPLKKFATIPFAFYLNLYGDIGYVKDKTSNEYNPLTNSWQAGYGAGIDLVTYYDMVFRFEYSWNKLGESGFFLHFTTHI